MLILAGILIGLYGLAVLLGDREPDGTVREGVAGAKRRRSKRWGWGVRTTSVQSRGVYLASHPQDREKPHRL